MVVTVTVAMSLVGCFNSWAEPSLSRPQSKLALNEEADAVRAARRHGTCDPCGAVRDPSLAPPKPASLRAALPPPPRPHAPSADRTPAGRRAHSPSADRTAHPLTAQPIRSPHSPSADRTAHPRSADCARRPKRARR
eukprot:1838449-Prymnesium_polylepis.1